MSPEQYERVKHLLPYLRGSLKVKAWSNNKANREAVDLYREFSGDSTAKYGCRMCIRKASEWLIDKAREHDA